MSSLFIFPFLLVGVILIAGGIANFNHPEREPGDCYRDRL